MYTPMSDGSMSASQVEGVMRGPTDHGGGRRRVIRAVWGRVGLHAPVRLVVAELARQGVEVSEALVTRVRIEILKETSGHRARQTEAPRGQPSGAWRPQKRPPQGGRA